MLKLLRTDILYTQPKTTLLTAADVIGTVLELRQPHSSLRTSGLGTSLSAIFDNRVPVDHVTGNGIVQLAAE